MSPPTPAVPASTSMRALLDAVIEDMGGQPREQQQHLHDAIAGAVAETSVLFAQAGTGTGKSLAYLTAVAGSGRTVIATATNQLSEQLARKDLPLVQEAAARLGSPVSFAQLKGRSNYLCVARLRGGSSLAPPESDSRGNESHSDAEKAASQLLTWAKTTPTGDRSDAPPVPDRVWRGFSVTSGECLGNTCPTYGECFTEKARRAARDADIIVTNHALIAHDLRAQLNGAESSIFGEYDTLIIDEAHDFTAAITDAFSFTVTSKTITTTITKATPYFTSDSALDNADHATEALTTLSEELTRLGKEPLTTLPEDLRRHLSTCAHYLIPLIHEIRDTGTGKSTSAKLTAKKLSETLADDCEAILTAASNSPNNVHWIDTTSTPRLHTAPLRITDAIKQLTHDTAVIATSATLTVAGSFEPITNTWGTPHARTTNVGTPFTYPTQGILYIPDSSMPSPVGIERTEHAAAVSSELSDLIAAAGGRTLALFTTTAATRVNAEHLKTVFPGLTILTQGDASPQRLIDEFTRDETSVLCATMGLWQGVDVPGSACSLVVVDKIPFPSPDDALAAARKADADASGQDGFHQVYVATAATSLAQAAGRLIRSTSDRGVVAILDPRLHTKNYGPTLVNSLPDLHRSNDKTAVQDALRRLTGGLSEATPRVTAPTSTKTTTRRGTKPTAGKKTPTAARRTTPTTTKKRIPPRGKRSKPTNP